jgi:hypothetical protein
MREINLDRRTVLPGILTRHIAPQAPSAWLSTYAVEDRADIVTIDVKKQLEPAAGRRYLGVARHPIENCRGPRRKLTLLVKAAIEIDPSEMHIVPKIAELNADPTTLSIYEPCGSRFGFSTASPGRMIISLRLLADRGIWHLG